MLLSSINFSNSEPLQYWWVPVPEGQGLGWETAERADDMIDKDKSNTDHYAIIQPGF